MTRCRFKLELTSEQCLSYYRGQVRNVVVRSDHGLRLALPASEIRRFVTTNGVHGRFEVIYDRNYKLVSLEQLRNRNE